MIHLLKSNKENIKALSIKIEEQKKLLKINKNDIVLKNIIKINQNTLNFLQNK